jgi:hypothetical protein
MKSLSIILLFVVAIFAAGGDTLKYSPQVNDLDNGDAFYADIHWHSLKDSIAKFANGMIGNLNIAADAEIALSKLDTTGRIKADSIELSKATITNFTTTKATIDSIINEYSWVNYLRGNTDIDSIQGLNVVRGNPDIDSITGGAYWSVSNIVGLAALNGNPTIDSIAGGTHWVTEHITVSDSAFIDTLTASQVKITGEINSVPLTDYGSTSTVVGWSSFTTKKIHYKRIGNTVWVWFTLSGTSDATTASFTLPYSVSVGAFTPAVALEGTSQISTAIVGVASSTANIYKELVSSSWANSGPKNLAGFFQYETTDAM